MQSRHNTTINSSAYSKAPYNQSLPQRPNTSHTPSSYDPKGSLGYGMGRILRGAFDSVYDAWQSWWNPPPSQEKLAQHRQAAIYREGLKTAFHQLDLAVEHARKNPRAANSLEPFKRVFGDYARYFSLAPTQKLRRSQMDLWNKLRPKIQGLKVKEAREALLAYLPPVQADTVISNAKRSTEQSSPEFPSPFNLTTLDGSNGFVVNGIEPNDIVGASVNTGGDINRDGRQDLVIGALGVPKGAANGTVYVIFGQPSFPPSFNLTTLNGANGFAINGKEINDYLGVSVSTGDVNGDGIQDVAAGAYFAPFGEERGAGYVIFGQPSFPSSLNLTNLNGSNGFEIKGVELSDRLGFSVSMVENFNGNGTKALLLGAPGAPMGMGYGAVYVISSQSSFPPSFNLTTLNGSNGFVVNGLQEDGSLGSSISTGGDINGDGRQDVALGAKSTANGAVYVIFGQPSFPSSFNLTTLNGSNGFVVNGLTPSELGNSVSLVGDLNGDSKADLVIGAPGAPAGAYKGAVYVIFGQTNFSSPFNLTTLNGSNGFVVNGINSGDQLGISISTAGDINGDGKADLVIGADGPPEAAGNGAVYTIFGQTSFPASFNLTTLNGTNGFVVNGIASNDLLGYSTSTAGDVNGDGIKDLAIGADGTPENAGNGAVYVIFGKNTSFIPPTPMPSAPMPHPAPMINLTACPSTQPLQWLNHDIIIANGQQLRLSPDDIATQCGNSDQPYAGAYFTVSGIRSAVLQKRNTTGAWNPANTFYGQDLAAGQVALLDDGSGVAPELNLIATDGLTVLPNQPVQVNFTRTDSTPVIIQFSVKIPPGGSAILNASDIIFTNFTGKPGDLIISVENVQNGYFAQTTAPNVSITEFTGYQLQTGQITVTSQDQDPLTFEVTLGDGLKSSVAEPVTAVLFGVPNDDANQDTLTIAGAAAGAVAFVGLGVAACGFFYHTQRTREDRFRAEKENPRRLNPQPEKSKYSEYGRKGLG